MFFFFSSRRRHTRLTCDWSSDVCSSDLFQVDREQYEITLGPCLGSASVISYCSRSLMHAELVEQECQLVGLFFRSEERRVGKECRVWWSPYHEKRKKNRRAGSDVICMYC